MALDVEKEFAKDQKVLVKRVMKGRPLHFGVQAKAAKSGKFLLSKKPGDVTSSSVKDLKVYEGKDAERENTIPGSASMGVAKGENGILTLYFERGKALPVAEKFVKHFVTRLLKCKAVKKVVIAEADQLPVVPESSDEDNFKATPESVKERATGLVMRLKSLGGSLKRLEEKIEFALQGAAGNPGASDDALDDAEFLLGAYERLASLERLLADTENQPGVAAEIVAGIRTKRLQVARQQLDGGQGDEADENLDIAEQSIANLRGAAGLSLHSEPLATPPSEPSTTTVLSPEEQKWVTARDKLFPEVERCLKGNLGDVGKIRAVRDFAQGKASSGDFAAALKSLDVLKELLKAAHSGEKATDVIPEGGVGDTAPTKERETEKLRGDPGIRQLQTARLNAARDVRELESKLRATGEPQAVEIADIIKDLVDRFPAHLETLLEGLAKATAENKVELAGKIKVAAKKAVIDWRGYLQKHARQIEGCEKNPWKISVSIAEPVQNALENIDTVTLA